MDPITASALSKVTDTLLRLVGGFIGNEQQLSNQNAGIYTDMPERAEFAPSNKTATYAITSAIILLLLGGLILVLIKRTN
jgi:hypothetical protein